MPRFEAHPDKPEAGTGAHFDFVIEHARAFLATSPRGGRDAFLVAERAADGGAYVTKRDLGLFPGMWSGVRQWVAGSRPSGADISALDFDDDGPTIRGHVPAFVAAPTDAPCVAEPSAPPECAGDTAGTAHAPTEPQGPHSYVFTWAQNATPIDDDFFATLLVFCEHRGAELVVLPGRYRNPTSIWSRENEGVEWWDERLEPYLHRGRMQVCPSLVAYGDVSTHPTAARPLTGWEVFAGDGHAIFGHPKIQLRTIPAPLREDVRIHVTTGAITVPNYTDSKAGKKGEAHHVQGACLVELHGDEPHIRQINAEDDGSFTDLCESFSPEGVEAAPRPLALITGDSHVAHAVDAVLDATFRAPDSIASTMRPERILFHDVLDFRSRNHHEADNPDSRFEKVTTGELDCVEDEVRAAVAYVDAMTPPDSLPVVVPSNHDEAFDRWLRSANPKVDPRNARYFHETRAALLRHFEDSSEWKPALEHAYEEHGAGRAHFIRRGDPYPIAGIACGFHGDHGSNGSRGSVLGYSRLAARVVIGHVHSPAITDGAYAVGVTGALDQHYNVGPSSWAHAHCLVYANGKRTLVFVGSKTGRWRRRPSTETTLTQVPRAG